jgi:predicted ATPase
MKPVFVVTGAFDCGKTTTLEWLRDHHGVRIHGEAHLAALERLGDRKLGHAPGQGFTPIVDPEHFCPMCRPREFAELVLAEQAAIETAAEPGDILERGFLDPIEMLMRNAADDVRRPQWIAIARYVRVILFEVMPELQRPRWGKCAATRVAEALAIQARLASLYRDAGYHLVSIPPGSVEARGARLLEIVRAS